MGGEMSKKIPEDEMLLAKLIQNAKSRGLGWCSGALYLTPYGEPRANPVTANRCCAIGAANLDPETRAEVESYGFVAHGNDNGAHVRWYSENSMRPADGETLGWAFRLAMKESDDE
jgi:hypothetical protein